MKEKEDSDNSSNINNENNNIYQHKIKDSIFPLNTPEKQKKEKEEKQTDTLASTLGFLKEDGEEQKNDNISNLTKSIGKTDDISMKQSNNSSDEKISTESTNESF